MNGLRQIFILVNWGISKEKKEKEKDRKGGKKEEREGGEKGKKDMKENGKPRAGALVSCSDPFFRGCRSRPKSDYSQLCLWIMKLWDC